MLAEPQRDELFIQRLPQNILEGEVLFVVAINQAMASNLRPAIIKARGPEFDKRVQCRTAEAISTWGRPYYSDNFVFHHSVWDKFSDLPKLDQDFIISLATNLSLGKFFDVKPDKKRMVLKQKGFFNRARARIASWIMP
jgi:hypothetical protein